MSSISSDSKPKCPPRNGITPLICIRDIVVAYQDNVALFDVNMDVYQGELIGVCGPNGSGKTTLLKALLGTLPLLRGQITIFGKDLNSTSKSFFHTRIGYVPQAITVDRNYPALVSDVVLMGLYGQIGLLRRPQVKDHEAVAQAIDTVGMSQFTKRPFGHLSTGQQQKILIARSLVHQPQILILDEPTASLDFRVAISILELIEKLHRTQNLTTVVVSHNIKYLRDYCTRIYCLDHRMIWSGDPMDPDLDSVLKRVFQVAI